MSESGEEFEVAYWPKRKSKRRGGEGAHGLDAVRYAIHAQGFVAGLRARLIAEMKPCPTCKRPRVTLRQMGARLGVSAATVMRWLSRGHEPNARTIDAAVRYLCRKPR